MSVIPNNFSYCPSAEHEMGLMVYEIAFNEIKYI